MPPTDRELKDKAVKWLAERTRELQKPATVVDSSDLTYGRVRVYRPDLRREMVINGLTTQPGTVVWISLRPDGEWSVDGINVPETVRQFGAAAGAAALPPNALDFAALSVRDAQFEPCRLQYSKQGGTYLHVTAFNHNGDRYQPAVDSSGNEDGSDDTDVAVYFPSATGEYGVIGCYYDPVAQTLVFFAGEHGYDLSSFAFDDRDSIPAGMIPVGAVLVTEGKDITASNEPIFFSWQTFVDETGYLLTGAAVTRTIASGVLTVGNETVVVVASEGGTSDVLATLVVAGAPRVLWLIADSGDTITIDHAADNIYVYAAADMDFGDAQIISCLYDGTNVFVAGGGGAGASFDIDSLTEEPAIDTANDYLPFYDATAAGNRKITPDDLVTALGSAVGSKLRYVENVLWDLTLGSAGNLDSNDADDYGNSGALSQDYDALKIRLKLNNSSGNNINCNINNDTTDAHYRYGRQLGGASSTADHSAARYAGGTTGQSNQFAIYEWYLPNYASTTDYKTMIGHGGLHDATPRVLDFILTLSKTDATSAITRIAFAPTSGNWEPGSQMQIIGVRREAIGGLATSDLNISATPTASELDAEFGSAASLPDGFAVVINDNGGGSNEWLVWSDGAKWFGVQGTELT